MFNVQTGMEHEIILSEWPLNTLCLFLLVGINIYVVVFPLLAGMFLLGYLVLVMVKRHNCKTQEAMWRIQFGDLVWEDPPYILGDFSNH